MSAVADFEKWLYNELTSTAAVVEATGGRVYNLAAPPFPPSKTGFPPYLIYQVTPLEDRFGQAGSSIQTRLLADVQIYAPIPFDEIVDEAIEAFRERVREQLTGGGIRVGNSLIAVRHDRPISGMVRGNVADQKIIRRGSTYKAWVSRAGTGCGGG